MLPQPGDRAVERALQLLRGFRIDILPGDDAAAPPQVGDLAAACRDSAAHQRLHERCGFVAAVEQSVQSVRRMLELDLRERYALRFISSQRTRWLGRALYRKIDFDRLLYVAAWIVERGRPSS